MPLADRRSIEFGILLLRRQGAAEPALLRASLAHRLPAGQRPPQAAEQAGKVKAPSFRGAPTVSAKRWPRGANPESRSYQNLWIPGSRIEVGCCRLRCAPRNDET